MKNPGKKNPIYITHNRFVTGLIETNPLMLVIMLQRSSKVCTNWSGGL